MQTLMQEHAGENNQAMKHYTIAGDHSCTKILPNLMHTMRACLCVLPIASSSDLNSAMYLWLGSLTLAMHSSASAGHKPENGAVCSGKASPTAQPAQQDHAE